VKLCVIWSAGSREAEGVLRGATRHRVRYAEFVAAGFSTSSGVTESGC
jgi:hypothetical protein